MPIAVADTGALRDPGILDYLRESPRNFVALPEPTQWESYAGDPLCNIANQLRHIGQFPRQVLILVGARRAIRLQNDHGRPISGVDLIDPGQSMGFPEFCDAVAAAAQGHADALRQVRGLGEASREQRARLEAGAREIARGTTMLAASLRPEQRKRMRRGDFTSDDVTWFWYVTFDLARHQLDAHEEVTRLPPPQALLTSWVLRYSAAGAALMCWWLRNGGIESISAQKLANDIADIAVIANATYFDTLLSRDSKLIWVNRHQRAMLERFREASPPELGWYSFFARRLPTQ